MQVKLSEILLFAADVAILKDFYRDTMGFDVIFESGEMAVFRQHLVIHPKTEYHNKPAEQPNNIHICFHVEDIFQAVSEIEGRGVSMLVTPQDQGPVWIALLKDPEGNVIELMQRKEVGNTP